MANAPAFTQLNEHVSIYRSTEVSRSSHGLDLIVLCAWFGAATKHITRYTDGYRRLFPYATILIIQSTVSSMMTDIDLDPAIQVLTSTKDNSTSSRTLIHAFSSGGARSASRICSSFESNCLFDALIFDCCPGTANASSISKAVNIASPDWPMLQQVKDAATYAAAGAYVGITKAGCLVNNISLSRSQLNDPAIVPPSIPRLYMYSKTDQLISAVDVHTHAREARSKGYRNVREVAFDDAPHVALIVEDADRYWNAVIELVQTVK